MYRQRKLRLSKRSIVNSVLKRVVARLSNWEQAKFKTSQLSYDNYYQMRHKLETSLKNFLPEEKALFSSFFELFEFKHRMGKKDKILAYQNQKGKFIGFLGPLGVAKTTIAQTLISDLQAKSVTHEPYDQNPFWSQSQNNPEFMLRSQMYFLFSNIFSDIRTKLSPDISVSDTSTLTDILMWAQWYHQTGHFDHNEYLLYRQLVRLLKNIIPKPDLLVILKPESIKDLKEGVRRRATQETQRSGELIFANLANNDLAVQVKIVEKLSKSIPKDWQIPVLNITVPSLRIFKDPHLKYEYIHSIREHLGLLGELIEPSPEATAEQAVRFLAESDERQIIIIHSKSMFTGKTTTECLISEKLGKKKVIAFQPQTAIRYQNQNDIGVMSRDGKTIPAITIKNNSLWTINSLIKEQKIDSKKFPYIFIDEVMLFIAHTQKPKEAVIAIETLRKMGFHVIVDGVDYTFQEEPFTFMHNLLAQAKKDTNWHAIEMSTRCRYCNKRAKGTRRWKINSTGKKKIAEYTDTAFLAGDSEYEPVCCDNHHKSCTKQPFDFHRQELP